MVKQSLFILLIKKVHMGWVDKYWYNCSSPYGKILAIITSAEIENGNEKCVKETSYLAMFDLFSMNMRHF